MARKRFHKSEDIEHCREIKQKDEGKIVVGKVKAFSKASENS